MKTSEGFSAVELLVTLFIGALFLLGGYQIWAFAQRSGAEADDFSRASSAAYEYLQKSSSDMTCTGTAASPTLIQNNVAITVSGLNSPRLTVSQVCPIVTGTTTAKVTSTVSYTVAGTTRSVSHATYYNR